MGLGLLGRGIHVTKFLAEEGAELIVTDLKTKEELEPSLTQLAGCSNITYVLGEHRLEDFVNRDMVIKAAGVPLDSPFIAEAKKHNIPVEMDASLFARLTEATLVGVTGTRGKSTTTHALYEILQKASEGTARRIYLGGNVRGAATLPLLREAKRGDIVVMELDSWQLQGFGEAGLSPHVAVFVTFMPDHMNYYRGDMEQYFADKSCVFRFQKPGDHFITNKTILEEIEKRRIPIPGILHLLPNTEYLIKSPLLGEHNQMNLAHAREAARALEVPESVIETALQNFKGLPGRLERIADITGVTVYNDTNATTPDATHAALKALGKEKNIILIMGGADKNLDMSPLIKNLGTYCKAVILLPGTGTSRIRPALAAENITLKDVESMREAVTQAFHAAGAGDIVLLSPAFASFGLFKNEYDRGDQFNNAVKMIDIGNQSLSKTRRVHCIGIGGIGLSALARLLHHEGNKVSGSDLNPSLITEALEREGIRVFTGHNAAHVTPDTDTVIYSVAVSDDNPELRRAHELGIAALTYPQALGEVTRRYKTIAIAGTHGKTTTTAMVARIFQKAGLKPTVILGSLFSEEKTNFIHGEGVYFIVEACEYQRSFLNLHPWILVITNIETEHLDYYRDLADIQSAFDELAAQVLPGGRVIREHDYAQDEVPPLRVIGEHNRRNAQAALAAARAAGIAGDTARAALAEFTGTWRRQEYKGKTKHGALVYDDYAHHPTEIKATLAAFRGKFPEERIIAVFQPHLYSRTKQFMNDFAESFGDANKVIIMPIYAAREKNDPGVSGEILAGKIKEGEFYENTEKLRTLLEKEGSGTIIIALGAGDIYKLAESLTHDSA